MAKSKKPYFWFPVVGDDEACPICGKPLKESKLMTVLYDGLNKNSIRQIHKMSYCSDCHIPFVTKETISNIEKEHPGFHLETGNMAGNLSKTFLEKRISVPARPIQNIPKDTLIFVGEEHLHKCGEKQLEHYQGIMHGKVPVLVKISKCSLCGEYLISPTTHYRIKNQCKDYIFAADGTWENVFPDKQNFYLLNINQYAKQTCPSCGNRLLDKTLYFKNDDSPMLQPKKVKQCGKCGMVFGRVTSFKGKPYSRYKFSHKFFVEEPFRGEGKHIIIKTGDFLTRHNLSGCIRNKHSMEDITASVQVADEAGHILSCDIPAVRCDTCGKLYILETEYQKIRKRGIPLCSIVENEYWGNGDGWQGCNKSDFKGSTMYVHGYNVAAANDLSIQQRHVILKTLMKDEILTKAEICSHLDMLIKRAGNQPHLKNAKAKWETDRAYMEQQGSGKEVIEVNSIKHRVCRIKTEDGKSGK